MRYVVMTLLAILAGCSPYAYDSSGYPVPYYGSGYPGYYSAARDYENCGTPDEPKACPAVRTSSGRRQSYAPLPGRSPSY
jgi:hypothetical protein